MSEENGKKLKEAGMARSVNKAESMHVGWSASALEFLRIYPKERFQIEDVRRFAEEGGLPVPHSKRAWGAITLLGKKQGIIRFWGYGPVENARAHRAIASVWERV